MPSQVVSEVVHECEHTVGPNGVSYRVKVYAEPRGNLWIGWLEFEPVGGGATLRTGQETSQPGRDALAYWASGLEPVYLEGAFERAAGQA